MHLLTISTIITHGFQKKFQNKIITWFLAKSWSFLPFTSQTILIIYRFSDLYFQSCSHYTLNCFCFATRRGICMLCQHATKDLCISAAEIQNNVTSRQNVREPKIWNENYQNVEYYAITNKLLKKYSGVRTGEMAIVLKTTFSNGFCLNEKFVFWLKLTVLGFIINC